MGEGRPGEFRLGAVDERRRTMNDAPSAGDVDHVVPCGVASTSRSFGCPSGLVKKRCAYCLVVCQNEVRWRALSQLSRVSRGCRQRTAW